MAVKEAMPSYAPQGSGVTMGDEQYLWLLVILEVAFLFFGRSLFKRAHGG